MRTGTEGTLATIDGDSTNGELEKGATVITNTGVEIGGSADQTATLGYTRLGFEEHLTGGDGVAAIGSGDSNNNNSGISNQQ